MTSTVLGGKTKIASYYFDNFWGDRRLFCRLFNSGAFAYVRAWLLPKAFKLVCVGRRPLTAKTYLDFILKKSHVLKKLSPAKKSAFLKLLIYHRGDFEHPENFKGLAGILSDSEKPTHLCYNRLFYFAASPRPICVHYQNFKNLPGC